MTIRFAAREYKVKTTLHPMREPALVKEQNRPIRRDFKVGGLEASKVGFLEPAPLQVFLGVRARSPKTIVVRPVRGDFKSEQSLHEALRGSCSNSARALLGSQNEVKRFRQLRNEVSRKHDMVVGSSVEARVATRNNKLRVVLRGEMGFVDAVYRSGRIHVNWSHGGSGWYTVTEIKNRSSAIVEKERSKVGLLLAV